MDRATRKLKKLPLLCLLLAPLTMCAADGNRVSMTPYIVNSIAGTQLKVVSLDPFDSSRAMTFLLGQSLLVTQKDDALWLLELVWQSPGEGSAAAEAWSLDHCNPLCVEKRVSQTLH